MGGRLEAASLFGKGSTFTVIIRQGIGDGEPVGKGADGLNAVLAKSGEQAIKILRQRDIRFDAIFMDQMMPEMDGFEAVRIIREEIGGYLKTILIIALTANALVRSEQMFLEKGFQDYLSKPVNARKLEAVIKKWLIN